MPDEHFCSGNRLNSAYNELESVYDGLCLFVLCRRVKVENAIHLISWLLYLIKQYFFSFFFFNVKVSQKIAKRVTIFRFMIRPEAIKLCNIWYVWFSRKSHYGEHSSCKREAIGLLININRASNTWNNHNKSRRMTEITCQFIISRKQQQRWFTPYV